VQRNLGCFVVLRHNVLVSEHEEAARVDGVARRSKRKIQAILAGGPMKLSRACLLTCTSLLALTHECMAQSTMVPWLTRSADNARTGWNEHETQLTQASVETKGIVRAAIIPVIGDARGMEAQPLILPNVQTARGMRDVMVLPSMADIVRGVDAHDGTGIWQVTLGMPITG
jgi:hypothetical protein